MPEVILSSSFHSIAGVSFRMPYGTVQNPKLWFLWYLVLRLFTCTSFSCTEPPKPSYQGALPLGTGCFKRLNTLTSVQNYTKVARLWARRFYPIFR